MSFNKISEFYKSAIITIILLYTLVLVGGFVRITESGDDCPDWPKCYGSWLPPMTIDDIPEEFNPTQDKVYGSWIEYFNRLLGVILGISMLYTFYKSIKVYKYDRQIFYGSFISLTMVIIAGWVGGQIAQNIDGNNVMSQYSVSIHLYIAMITLISIVYTTNRSFLLINKDCEKNNYYTKESYYMFFAILVINLLLVFSGSFIRTYIDDDSIKKISYFLRMEYYVENTGIIKFAHPILGFSMLALLGLLWNHVNNLSKSSSIVKSLLSILLILIMVQIIIGEGLRFNFIHETFRLYHLWISTVILGIVIVATQRIKFSK